MSAEIRTYVEPAKRFGWVAVADEPIETSKWWLPPRHRIWRPTRNMARNAIPKAVARLRWDVERRERDMRADAERKARRESS